MRQSLDDAGRLASLQALGLLDSEPDPIYDRFTRLVAKLLDVPVALVSLVDDHRQFFKSCIGLPPPWDAERQTPLSHSFCQHCVNRGEPLIIVDATNDPLVRNNLAVSELGVRAYLGIPIFVEGGYCVGSLCAIDTEPRDWTEADVESLTDVCRSLETELRLLQQLNDATEVSRRKSVFMAELSHELRNPMTPVLGIAQLLANGQVGENEQQEMYNVLLQQSRQLTRLVDELLDLSRIERGKIKLSRGPCDLVSIVRHSAETIQDSLKTKSLSLTVLGDERPCWVYADQSRLIQVVTNLLTNACRYTQKHGNIQVEVFSASDQGCLVVSDDGIGLSEQELKRVFDLFHQAPSARSRQRGLGIGLSLVRRLVELHDGQITMASQGRGSGCRATVRLPSTGEPISLSQADSVESGQTCDLPLDILVVDDQSANRYVLRCLLEAEGHRVRAASSVKEAWDEISRRAPSVIFSDIQMPEIDGHEFARQVRADDRVASVPLVAVTGEALSSEAEAAKAAGFDMHLNKPVSAEKLRGALSDVKSEVQAD
ncbi:ATP-binding protein [Planctomycetes bacterium TBK1r]|uniref:histidine kinase n=1 Tax=Stieleria magnilauensis TaxID=2527963 RepID=A0ABX5Y329_9BACT|nr:Autoinducer 2 sensor kinase/phosphatase LuxQ [Planctomycetes bacterium TBK1r]